MTKVVILLSTGYNYQCDAKQLAHSYGDLNCFKQCEMLLDIQNVFKEPGGGLSGLAKVPLPLTVLVFCQWTIMSLHVIFCCVNSFSASIIWSSGYHIKISLGHYVHDNRRYWELV